MSRKEHFLQAAGLDLKGSLLFHGTSPESAESIMREGFRLDAGERHGRSGGQGVYLHHDPEEAAKYGEAMVVARKKGTLANFYDMAWDRMHVNKGLTEDEHAAQYLSKYGNVGYKDPDDNATIIYDTSALKPVAISRSGQCPVCSGNGFHPRTAERCPTCTGRGVLW